MSVSSCSGEGQYGLIHYPDMHKKDGSKKSNQFGRYLGYRAESDYTHSSSSPMSVSSCSKTSALTPISTSMITSQGGSDSEVLYGVVKTPRRRVRREWISGKAITSPLSPFAK